MPGLKVILNPYFQPSAKITPFRVSVRDRAAGVATDEMTRAGRFFLIITVARLNEKAIPRSITVRFNYFIQLKTDTMSLKTFAKHAFVALAALFFFAGTALAQDSLKTAEGRAKAISQKMKTKLNLSDDQYNKVYEINLKYGKQNETVMQGSGDRMTKFQTLRTQNEEKNKELKTVLTKEQYEEYEKIQKEMRQEAMEKMKDRRRGD